MKTGICIGLSRARSGACANATRLIPITINAAPARPCPPTASHVQHAWHLYVIQLNLDRLRISRDEFIRQLQHAGVGCSVHFIPLHLHPYHRDRAGYRPEDFPVASMVFQRIVSLPLYSKMTEDEINRVIETVRDLVKRNRR